MKSVLSKIEADKIAILHSPQKFTKAISATAHDFVAKMAHAVESGAKHSSFRLDGLVAQLNGVAELERVSLEERVEREALIRLKELQEQAYKEGYLLGCEEGREKAFVDSQVQLNGQIDSLRDLLSAFENLKTDLVGHNESQIVELIFHMARRLLADEVSARPEVILGIVRQAIENIQSDEKLTIKVSPRDFAFIESVKDKLGKEFETVLRARLESSEDVANGGCLLTTAFGDVDSTIEQRLSKLWTALAEKLPRAGEAQAEKKDG
jgi:flagellar assembly protein FliH